MTPPSEVPCPPRNFVAECTAISTPTSFARCRYGVATVLSTTSGTPARCAMSDTVRTSSTCAIGFVIDSANSARVVGRIAAAHACGSSWSTKVTSMPQSAKVSCSRSTVPPYSWRAATMCSPCFARASSATATAACPDATARGGDASFELRDTALEDEDCRVRGPAVDVAIAAEREQVARIAQRARTRRHWTGGSAAQRSSRRHRLIPRLHLRRREGTRGLGHSSIVGGRRFAAPSRVSNCCASRPLSGWHDGGHDPSRHPFRIGRAGGIRSARPRARRALAAGPARWAAGVPGRAHPWCGVRRSRS